MTRRKEPSCSNVQKPGAAVKRLFRKLEKDDQWALQIVVIDGMSLRQTAQQLGISAMTVQLRVKRGLNSLSKELNAAQLDA